MRLRRILILLLIALHVCQGFATVRMNGGTTQNAEAAMHLAPCHEKDMGMQALVSVQSTDKASELPDCCKNQSTCAMCVSVGLQVLLGAGSGIVTISQREMHSALTSETFQSAPLAAPQKPPIL